MSRRFILSFLLLFLSLSLSHTLSLYFIVLFLIVGQITIEGFIKLVQVVFDGFSFLASLSELSFHHRSFTPFGAFACVFDLFSGSYNIFNESPKLVIISWRTSFI